VKRLITWTGVGGEQARVHTSLLLGSNERSSAYRSMRSLPAPKYSGDQNDYG